MASVAEFLTRTRGRANGGTRLPLDRLGPPYTYLTFGILLMFGPVVWLVLSSFKTEADLQRYPPTFLPYQQQTMLIEGYDEPLPLFRMTGRRLRGHGAGAGPARGPSGADGRSRQPGRTPAHRHRGPRTRSARAAGDRELHRAFRALHLPALFLELDLHHADVHGHHAAGQLHGRLRAVEIPVPGAHDGTPARDRDAHDPADRGSRAAFS